MLYIEKGDKVKLPAKYHAINNYCAIIYDLISEILVSVDYNHLIDSKLVLDEKKQRLIDELLKGDINVLDWLNENDLDDELVEILTKHITLSIVSDFSNFIYESLSCAKKGKMIVAYALLRKPLTDELLLLEQLLYNSEDFVNRFYHSGNPKGYDPSSASNDKRKIIRNALTKLSYNLIYTENLIYDLRYNKECSAGIDGISNRSLHIVTNDKRYKTEEKNLNFIFSSVEDVERFWNHYYYFVPYLLNYSASIINNIIFRFLPEDNNLKASKSFKLLIGSILWNEKTKPTTITESSDIFNSISQAIKVKCPNCKNENVFKREDFELFFESDLLLCSSCFQNLLSFPEVISHVEEFMNVSLLESK